MLLLVLQAHFFFLFVVCLHIISWNVNGLHMKGAHGPWKLLFREELNSHFFGDVDDVLAQEHKLSHAHPHR